MYLFSTYKHLVDIQYFHLVFEDGTELKKKISDLATFNIKIMHTCSNFTVYIHTYDFEFFDIVFF